MKILAVDTSSSVAAVAVIDGAKLLGEFILNHKKTHSQKLMPMMQELLTALELAPEDIDVYAASIGPGSFTGLRIGITTVKAVAYAVNKPVVSVPTLEAMANNLPAAEGLVCPIMDARNSQVFTALYQWNGQHWSGVTECMGIPVSQLVEIIKERNGQVVFLGDGVELHRDFLQEKLGENCSFAPAHLLLQRAASVAMVACRRANMGEFESSFDMVPFYLRKSQAERELEKRQLTVES